MTVAAMAENCQPGTIGAVLHEASDALLQVTEVARLEAEVLLAHATGLSRATLLGHPERHLAPTQQARYRSLLRRRASGYPLPYLIGRIEFYGLEFAVTRGTLIPRPETERLVDLALERQPHVVVDVGTGSGCVAVALAVHLPDTRIYATELSASALRVAFENVARHGVQDRVRLIQCDLVDSLSGPVDLVVSNPPYVAGREWRDLPRSVQRYEPRLALDGGSDGLGVIRRLLATAPRLLRPRSAERQLAGALLIEIGATQGGAATALARSLLPGAHVSIHPDLAGRDRVLEVGLRG